MDEHHFELWADNLRRMNIIWNKGFRWGVFSGATLMFVILWLMGWYLNID